MSLLHARRGSQSLRFGGAKVISHRIIGAERAPTDEVVEYNLDDRHLTADQMREERPFDSLLKEHFGSFKQSTGDGMLGVLYCGMVERSGPEGRLKFVFKSSHLQRLYSSPVSPEYTASVGKFFSFLGPHITAPSVTPYADMVTMTTDEFFRHAVDNYSPLMAALHGLATSQGDRDLTRITGADYPDYQSVYLAIAAARDLILRCSHKYPCHFQLMIGNLLEMESCSSVFKDTLSAFRACYSRDHYDKKQCEAVVKKLEKLGKHASYDQWILFQDIIVRENRLRELNIIADDPDGQLSREPVHDWLELVEADEGSLAKELVTPTAVDYEALTPHTLCARGNQTREKLEAEDRQNERERRSTRDSTLREIPLIVTPTSEGSSIRAPVKDKSTFYGDDISLNIINEDLARKQSTTMIAGLKMHNCCGLMFGNFVKQFMAAWRDTLAKIYWILFPKDPRQLENELSEYILTMYRSAFLWLWDLWGRVQSKIPTAADVHHFMLERAKDCPYRQACLIEIRYAEVTKLLKNASRVGKRGSVELFMTAVRFALPLWATTHAVEYVRLGCDLLIFWKHASPAMKALYKNEIFTGLTSQGESMPRDECMEGSVKHTRKYAGKVRSRGTEKKLEKTVSRIPDEKSQNLQQKKLRGGPNKTGNKPRTRNWFNPDSPAIRLFELVHNKMQLWHHTNQPIIGDYDKETPLYADPNSFRLPENETLLPDVLRLLDIGVTRVKKYMQTYYIDTSFRVDRSEKEVPLTKLLASTIDRRKELKRIIDREVSLVEADLKVQ
ncbi:hypothetical protein ACHAWF_015642 [Thalassiosira exigua]